MPDLISRIDIRIFQRTMNGLSSCLEYGRGTDFADGLPRRWGAAWLSCDEPPIWDMTYVNDGYGGTTWARITEGHRRMKGRRQTDEITGNRIWGEREEGKEAGRPKDPLRHRVPDILMDPP